MLYRGEILELNPNRRQTTYFRKACGVARLAYNWGIEEWTRQYQAGGKPNYRVLDKQFNALKRERFPFVTEVTKCAAQIALQQLGAAFANFFRGTSLNVFEETLLLLQAPFSLHRSHQDTNHPCHYIRLFPV